MDIKKRWVAILHGTIGGGVLEDFALLLYALRMKRAQCHVGSYLLKTRKAGHCSHHRITLNDNRRSGCRATVELITSPTDLQVS